MLKRLACIGFVLGSVNASGAELGDIVCSYAPSQSKAASAISGAAGGAGASLVGIAQALGLTVVTHSSGAAILTGSSGYIAGTLGAAAAGPIIVAVGAVVGGVATTVELVCVRKNHPGAVEKVVASSKEFSNRTKVYLSDVASTTRPKIDNVKSEVKRIAGDAWDYANGIFR